MGSREIKKIYYKLGVFITIAVFMISASPVFAADSGGHTGVDVTSNLVTSISRLPTLLAGLSYLAGMTFGVLGVLKIKDHVENPKETPMQGGAVRLGAGAALLALPMLFEVMTNSFGTTSTEVAQAGLADLVMY